jgi:hypothetical protein
LKGEDQRGQWGPGRDRVLQQLQPGIGRGESFGGDAGTDYGRHQEQRADSLRGQPAGQRWGHRGLVALMMAPCIPSAA